MRHAIGLTLMMGLLWLGCGPKTEVEKEVKKEAAAAVTPAAPLAEPQAISLLGKSLYKPEPIADIHQKNYVSAREKWQADQENIDNWIWYGRRTAYLGEYRAAIDIYTRAMEKFPADARLLRHRGHRYITLRKFDLAITDFKQAVRLLARQADQIEEDGLPNEKNIPLSTLQNNVWYHLGLAHYLKNEMNEALYAYKKSLALSQNDDMKVACQYWLFMILRRLDRKVEAKKLLEPLKSDLEIIENMAYYKLCLFFKGTITQEELRKENNDLADYMNDALGYGLGNWYFFNAMAREAEKQWRYVIEHSNWAGFACIAAEADYVRFFANKPAEPGVPGS